MGSGEMKGRTLITNYELSPSLGSVFYIASSSRSGSTLLDMLLGSHASCCSVGEMRRINHFYCTYESDIRSGKKAETRICTCGKPVYKCNFWTEVQERSRLSFEKDSLASIASVSTRRLIQNVYFLFGPWGVNFLAKRSPTVMREIRVAGRCFTVYETISRMTGKNIVVDSSKQIYHYIMLHSFCPSKMKLIRLVRDGRAVVWSMTRGDRKNNFLAKNKSPVVEASKAWRRASLLSFFVSLRTPRKCHILVRYEDLCKSPSDTVERIYLTFGLRGNSASQDLGNGIYHNIGGSPSRFNSDRKMISIDLNWREHLSPKDMREFSRTAGWLNRMLGYE
jgi:hypothetical protein